MIAVIFEVEVSLEKRDGYFNLAANLRPELEAIDGFVSVERFQSFTNPEKILSLSFFESESAVIAWRNRIRHREAQEAGRGGIFRNYRLRVANVLRDYGMHERSYAPTDSDVWIESQRGNSDSEKSKHAK